MLYEQDISGCLSETIGPGGLSAAELEALLEDLKPTHLNLRDDYQKGSSAFLLSPKLQDIDELQSLSAEWRERFETILVLGVGGSSLGGKTLCALTQDQFGSDPDGPRLIFLENIDPHTFGRVLNSLRLDKTGVLAISKSGETMETVIQALLCISVWKKFGFENVSANFLAISQPGKNSLRLICKKERIRVLESDPEIGGRYSVLSLVGVLPGLMAGIDGRTLREGANEVAEQLIQCDDLRSSAPALGAAISIGLASSRGISQNILFPYSDRLVSFSRWYCQLWAESLGKKGLGTTPIDALGVVDQHSKLQLYLDGPKDKFFTFIGTNQAGLGDRITDKLTGEEGLRHLSGCTIGDVFDAEEHATAQTLMNAGLPTRTIRIQNVDESNLGSLIMHFMLETIFSAALLDVNPFDQPAVESGKRLTLEYLERLKSE
jgi:glucose-6-phosphate isomerase